MEIECHFDEKSQPAKFREMMNFSDMESSNKLLISEKSTAAAENAGFRLISHLLEKNFERKQFRKMRNFAKILTFGGDGIEVLKLPLQKNLYFAYILDVFL